jgi:hypothetical protein
MQLHSAHTMPAGFIGYVSKHRFNLTMLVCALVLAVMLAVVYSEVGFGPFWAVHTLPASP